MKYQQIFGECEACGADGVELHETDSSYATWCCEDCAARIARKQDWQDSWKDND